MPIGRVYVITCDRCSKEPEVGWHMRRKWLEYEALSDGWLQRELPRGDEWYCPECKLALKEVSDGQAIDA